jgi:hypothetical protein
MKDVQDDKFYKHGKRTFSQKLNQQDAKERMKFSQK